MKRIGLMTLLLFVAVANAMGNQLLFHEDFEMGLSVWTGRGGGSHTGIVVEDPLDSNNSVLTFTSLTEFGDVFSPDLQVARDELHVFVFDYLGIPGSGGMDGNLGGFAGIADETPGDHQWVAGTILQSGAYIELVDDGAWHTYQIPFRPSDFFQPNDGAIRLMFEDWFRSEGVPGDAFFDNIMLVRDAVVTVQPSTWATVKSPYSAREASNTGPRTR